MRRLNVHVFVWFSIFILKHLINANKCEYLCFCLNFYSCQLLSISSSTFCVPPMTARDCVLCVVRGLITPRVRARLFLRHHHCRQPPSNPAANLTNLLRNHLSSNSLPPMRQFMKRNLILVLKKEVPIIAKYSPPNAVQQQV